MRRFTAALPPPGGVPGVAGRVLWKDTQPRGLGQGPGGRVLVRHTPPPATAVRPDVRATTRHLRAHALAAREDAGAWQQSAGTPYCVGPDREPTGAPTSSAPPPTVGQRQFVCLRVPIGTGGEIERLQDPISSRCSHGLARSFGDVQQVRQCPRKLFFSRLHHEAVLPSTITSLTDPTSVATHGTPAAI